MPWRSFTWTRRAHKNWRKLQKVAGHRYLEPMQLLLQDFKIWRKLGHQAFSTGTIRCQVSCGGAPLTLMMTLIATARMETSQSAGVQHLHTIRGIYICVYYHNLFVLKIIRHPAIKLQCGGAKSARSLVPAITSENNTLLERNMLRRSAGSLNL